MLHCIIGVSMCAVFSDAASCIARLLEIADEPSNLKRRPTGGSSHMYPLSQHIDASYLHRGRPAVLLAICRSMWLQALDPSSPAGKRNGNL